MPSRLTTAQAADALAARGITVSGHPPTVRNVDAWCRSGALAAERVGTSRRGVWLVAEEAVQTFTPRRSGRPRRKA